MTPATPVPAAPPVPASAKPARRGRPRSKSARRAILRSALELLREVGYARLTMEAVAERSRSGKATIYRWWPNKAALAAEAYLEDASPSLPFPDTGSVREDFRRQMQLLAQFLNGPKGRTLAVLMGQGQDEPELLRTLQHELFEGWRSDAAEAMLRGIRAGQVRPGVYTEIALDALYGPLFHRFLSGHGGLTPDYVDALCEAVMTGIAPPGV
ncbi:MAG: TetR/AcrR family transcriptional regulator [Bryobacteraceae bacterium]